MTGSLRWKFSTSNQEISPNLTARLLEITSKISRNWRTATMMRKRLCHGITYSLMLMKRIPYTKCTVVMRLWFICPRCQRKKGSSFLTSFFI